MSLANEYRARAKAQRDTANALIADKPLDLLRITDEGVHVRGLITVLVGHLNATVLEAAADLMDQSNEPSDEETEPETPAEQASKDSNSLREAAAKAMADGNWDEYNRIIARLGRVDT